MENKENIEEISEENTTSQDLDATEEKEIESIEDLNDVKANEIPQLSDEELDKVADTAIDYKCMPGLILFAPDDLDMELSKEDVLLNFWLGAASESGIPIAIKSKRKGARTHLVGRNSSITWGMDRSTLEALDPKPDEAESKQMQLEFMGQENKLKKRNNINR